MSRISGGMLEPLPTAFMQLEMTYTNPTSLPDDLGKKWHPISIMYLEHSLITEFPKVLLRLQVRLLSLHSNLIERLLKIIHQFLIAFTVSDNPLVELPETLGEGPEFIFFGTEDTLIGALPAWVHTNVAVTTYLSGTPYCATQARAAASSANLACVVRDMPLGGKSPANWYLRASQEARKQSATGSEAKKQASRMRVEIDGLEVLFPYERMYAEQLQYMRELKRALDAQGHCMLEMPTGTGKTVSLLSLVLAYKFAHPTAGKLIYCTRTVPEMSKCVEELKNLVAYREKYYGDRAQLTAVCLSSRRNMCVHPRVMAHADGETVDGQCRKMTASWVRSKAATNPEEVETCSFYENYETRKSDQTVLPPGVYAVDDLKELGTQKGWCPYFLTRYVVTFADVIVYNYQYMLDPKVSAMVSRSFEKESIVVFDEAHNIDNVCIEALSVELDRRSLDRASRNLTTISSQVTRMKQADKARLDDEYRRLVEGLRSSDSVVAPTYTNPANQQRIDTSNDILMANPVLPDDVLDEAIPGNIRRAEHFIAFMRRLIEYLRTRIRVRNVESETPQAFLHHLNQAISMEIKPMKFCYTRLNSLMRTLEITNLEEFNSLTAVADFATLVATYADGFMLIIEPFDGTSGVHDPVLQLACLDASLAIRPVFERFSSVIITSGTLSPIDLYPRLLNFNPVIRESLPMSVYRSCICPMVITRGSDQMPVSTKFDLRDDMSVVRNYGTLLLEMAASCPDGMVCFFPSYLYMAKIIGQWDSLGVLKRVLQSKLLFIETTDIVETTLALDNYKKACDCGRGAIFFSVARGKVAEGIDFDRHYGRAVILFGIPFQYTLSNKLRARLEYLRYTHQIREGDFLTFDALRQAAQCAGRVLRSKTDYGLIIFADSRYNRLDKRTKLPPWITQFLVDSHLNLSVDMAVFMAKKYLSLMAQPADDSANLDSILLDTEGVAKWLGKHSTSEENGNNHENGAASGVAAAIGGGSFAIPVQQ